jgi:hypothetical protein
MNILGTYNKKSYESITVLLSAFFFPNKTNPAPLPFSGVRSLCSKSSNQMLAAVPHSGLV